MSNYRDNYRVTDKTSSKADRNAGATPPAAFEKRVKRRIRARAHDFFAICPPGLKSLCERQMVALGIPDEDMSVEKGGISFTARLEQLMALNLDLGTPSRILMRIARFKSTRFSHFEKKLAELDWELFIQHGSSIRCHVTTRESALYHSGAIAERCRRAIENSLDSKGWQIPGLSLPTQRIFIHAQQDRFTISLDTSGELLFKRGIKKKVAAAPLRENLAFAILKWADFGDQDILVDPMCGSGTFSLEGAMIRAGLPPGCFRSFAFEGWPAFSPAAFAYQKKNKAAALASSNLDAAAAPSSLCASERPSFASPPSIFASDIDETALTSLSENIAQPPFSQMIQTAQQDFFFINPTRNFPGKKGVLVLNPPYGKRLGKEEDTRQLYRDIGRKIAGDFRGWRLGMVLPSRRHLTYTGLPLSLRPIFHGGMDIFAGIGTI